MTAIAQPRFRTDLVAEPIDDGGKRFIDVVDPDSGNGFRFFEIEYSIACAMDGQRDIAGIQRWAREELGLEPSATEVATVISTLGDLGYLEGTAPGAVAAADEPELAAGVVVAATAAAPAPSFADVELGTAGAVAHHAADEPLPTADVELGFAGAGTPAPVAAVTVGDGPELGPSGGPRVMEFDAPTPPPPAMPSATLRPSSRPDAEEDGPTNLPKPQSIADEDEVSVDLADHLAVSASDVKEAVRASKVMAAVEVPKDVLDQLEASEAAARETAAREQLAREAAAQEAAARDQAAREAAAREQAARDAAAREQAAREQAEREAAAREAAAREAAAQASREQLGRPVTDLPQIPVGVSRKKPASETGKAPDAAPTPAPAPAASGGTSKALVFLLILVVLLAGAFVVWTKVLKKPLPWEKQTAESTPAKPTPPPPAPPPPPPPPPPPTAQLTEKPGDVSNVVAGQVGQIAMVIADGAQVAVGDELLRFAASAADEKKLTGLDNDLNVRYPKQLRDATAARDKAQASGSAGALKAAQAKVDEVQKKIDARAAERDALKAKLDALTIKAAIAGVVKLETGVAKGTRTTAEQAVATVTGPSSLVATFTIPTGGKSYSQDASVMVSTKDGLKANCTATAVDGPTVVVTCPADGGVAAGATLTLE